MVMMLNPVLEGVHDPTKPSLLSQKGRGGREGEDKPPLSRHLHLLKVLDVFGEGVFGEFAVEAGDEAVEEDVGGHEGAVG